MRAPLSVAAPALVASAALLMSVAIADAAAAQRNGQLRRPSSRSAAESDDGATLELVLEPIDGDPARALAFGVIGLPLEIVEAAARRLSTEDWKEVFTVHVADESAVAPILGEYRVTGDGVWMVPAFPPEPGMRYRAVLRPMALAVRLGFGKPDDAAHDDDSVEAVEAVDLEWLADVPRLRADLWLDALPPSAPTRVEAVYPGGDEVPENLLRFYVHFTAPMSRGSVHRWIRLEDEQGDAIDLPFLELAEELWDRDGRRLTLLLDPGRIKLGLRPHQEEGTALKAEHRVFLVVDARWPDARGHSLAASSRHGFRVGPADHDAIDPSRWRLTAPPAGSRDPLRAALGEPIDHALLHRMLWIEDAAGSPVAGSIETADGERTWSFAPDSSWQAGGYVLRVDRRLEDLAGNRVGRAFEVDLTAPRADDEAQREGTPVSLPFAIATD